MSGDLQLAIRITADGKVAVAELEKIGTSAGKMRAGLEAANQVKPLDARAIDAATQALARVNTETARAAGNAMLLGRAHVSLNAQLERGQISQAQHAAALRNLNQDYGQAARAAGAAAAGSDQLSGSLSRVAQYAVGLVALNQLVGYAKQALDLAEGYKQMEARLKLATSTSAEFAAAQASIVRIANTVGVPLAETTQLYTRMAPVLKEAGYEQRQISALSEIVAKSLRLSGAGAQESAAAMLQFTQAMGSGVLRGDEFNSLMENSPVLMRNLAKGMDVPIGQLRKMAEEGELSSKRVAEALLKMKDQIDKDFSKLPVSVSQAWQRLANNVQIAIGELDKAGDGTSKLAAGIDFVSKNLDVFVVGIGTMVVGLGIYATAAALATTAGAAFLTATAAAAPAILAVVAAAAALGFGYKALTGDQKALTDDTKKTDSAMGELNKSIVQLTAENGDPGIIEGITRLREALAEGRISADQAAYALGRFISMKDEIQGLGTAAETYFKAFLPPAKAYAAALAELEAHAKAARAKGLFDAEAYARALHKIQADLSKKNQELAAADAQAHLKAMSPPTELVREALKKLEDEYRIAQKNGVADEAKYWQERAKIITTALAEGAGKVAETRQKIAADDRRRAIGDLAFQVEQIRKGYEAEIAASKGQIDESELRSNIEKRIEADIAAMRKKLATEFIADGKAATDAALENARALAKGEEDAAARARGAWTSVNDTKSGGPEKSLSEIFAGGAGTRVNSDGSTTTTKFFFADGGRLVGPGTPTSDSILLRGSVDEFMVKASSARRVGYGVLDYINRTGTLPGFADGGRIGGSVSKAAPSTPAGNVFQIDKLILPDVTDVEGIAAKLEELSRMRPLRINTVAAGRRPG